LIGLLEPLLLPEPLVLPEPLLVPEGALPDLLLLPQAVTIVRMSGTAAMSAVRFMFRRTDSFLFL
jgi:hypothetical protein